jgi:hypothetical protein
MASDEKPAFDPLGLEKPRTKRSKATKWAENWRSWYDGDDPVVQSAVRDALSHLGAWTCDDYDEEELRNFFQRLDHFFRETKDWGSVQSAAGGGWVQDDPESKPRWVPGDLNSLDSVDHLMALWHGRRRFKFDIPPETALMLVTLAEAKANRPGVAVKSFFVGKSKPLEEGYALWQERTRREKVAGKRLGKRPTIRQGIFDFTKQLVRSSPGITAKEALRNFRTSYIRHRRENLRSTPKQERWSKGIRRQGRRTELPIARFSVGM